MKLRNDEMDKRLQQLAPLMERKDMVGYAAGRNYRRLVDACTEWTNLKMEALQKYGTPVLDDDGNPTDAVEIARNSEDFQTFVDELAPYAGIEHEVEIFTIPYEHAQNELTGQQVYELYWMFHDDEKGPENGN